MSEIVATRRAFKKKVNFGQHRMPLWILQFSKAHLVFNPWNGYQRKEIVWLRIILFK